MSDNCWNDGWSGEGCRRAPTVPSPQPPWRRQVTQNRSQYISGDDIVDLGTVRTYLNQTTTVPPQKPPNQSASYYTVELPNGRYVGDWHEIFIVSQNQLNTVPFSVFGTFVGFNSLVFNNAAYSALLEWDGAGWQLVGGNAQPSSNNTPS